MAWLKDFCRNFIRSLHTHTFTHIQYNRRFYLLKTYGRLKCSVYCTVTTQYEYNQQRQRFTVKQIQCWLCERTVRFSNLKRENVSFKWSFYCLLAMLSICSSLLFFSKFNCRWRRLKIYYHLPPFCWKFHLQGNFSLAIKYKSLWLTYRITNFNLADHKGSVFLFKKVKHLGTIFHLKLSFRHSIVERKATPRNRT